MNFFQQRYGGEIVTNSGASFGTESRRWKTDEFGEDFNAKDTKNAKERSHAFPVWRSSLLRG